VSPKAIFTREHFSTIRGGVLAVLKADEQTLKLAESDLQPGQFSTGDYYIKTTDRHGEQRFRISANTSDSVTIANNKPLHREPGSKVEIQVRLQLPHVDPNLCIGCGICEHECPVSGKRAIRVTAENETRSPGRSLVLRSS
jgi:NAD-dependent dihydropyrimidine dehydrogenase PreA subunit